MKLELKHLAPYLPYNLHGFICTKRGDNFEVELHLLSQYTLQTSPSIFGYTYCSYNDFKPILRPLSDLTKEIEYNGERFVPNLHKDFKIFVQADMDYFLSNIIFAPFIQIQHLFQWHFDVFGLIDAGLAVDMNSLEEYT